MTRPIDDDRRVLRGVQLSRPLGGVPQRRPRMRLGPGLVLPMLAALALAGMGVFVWVGSQLVVCQPVLDMIPVLSNWLDSPNGILGTLFLPLNEHRLVWLRILTPADFQLTGGWPVLSGASSLLLLACLVAVPGWAMRQARLAPWLRRSGIALLVLLVFAPPAAEDTVLVINGVYPQVAGFAMLSLAAAAGGRWVLGFGLAVLAVLSNGVALVLLPILPWQAWRAGASPRAVLALGFAGGALGLAYVLKMPQGEHHAPDLYVALRYNAAMLGLPASHSSTLGRTGLGWLPGAVLGFLGLLVLCRKPANVMERLAQGGILFGLGAAVLGALARTDIAGGLPPVRYTPLVLGLQIGLLCLALQASQAWAQRRPNSAAMALLGVGAMLFAQSALAGQAMVSAMAESRLAVARFAAGDRDKALEPFIFPDLAAAARVWRDLPSRGASFCR